MVRQKRDWHPKFKEYMKFIINHPNYKGMPFLYKKNGEICWIVARSSERGLARWKWWDKKRKELGLPKSNAWISKVARAIHPTGEKPCQICGKVMKLDYVYPNKKGGLSPGAMSNAPDRLDGFHTYNLCCRSEQDTGRHKSNLARYGEDRRAYENWAEGDWKAASWLMKEFQKNDISPDHLGPISLGFRHAPKFRPLSRAANSARNNRMAFKDVKLLIEEENKEKVISAHSKYIWNLLKNRVRNDSDALKLSKLMRENVHCVLSIFSYIANRGYKRFLIKYFLHPEYANYSIRFEQFDPKTGLYKKMVKNRGTKKQYKNNIKRYIRISFESLKKYSLKKNRNLKQWLTDEIENSLKDVIQYLKNGNEKRALLRLFKVFKMVGENLSKKFN
ncbi:MAG: hypothetical protein PHO90_00960 [Candidatus Pacebacteria bacterium]|nr:hypothetical protein [Candidatus Paceibacterota bacterium]